MVFGEFQFVTLLKNSTQIYVRLGMLLQKRKIKPGAVVTQWSHSRGKHQGELSKAELDIWQEAEMQASGLSSDGKDLSAAA